MIVAKCLAHLLSSHALLAPFQAFCVGLSTTIATAFKWFKAITSNRIRDFFKKVFNAFKPYP
ncbi:hypothetical protein HMPREF1400_00912 [Helicobacter pylori GAM119Bi]|nr:hypothetical protein HMPREF1400_00912 [Helicobacter pylori GAM119Bi]